MKKTKLQEIKELISKWNKKDWDWRIRNLENIFDDSIDNIKHKIHGMKILGFKIYLPKWLMNNSGKEGK